MSIVSFYTRQDFFSKCIELYLKDKGVHVLQHDIKKINIDIFHDQEDLIVVNLCVNFITALKIILMLNGLSSKMAGKVIFICTSDMKGLYSEIINVNYFSFLILEEKYSAAEIKSIFYSQVNKTLIKRKLTERELLILLMIISGKSIANVSKVMRVDCKTIYSHTRNACLKLNLKNIRNIHEKFNFC